MDTDIMLSSRTLSDVFWTFTYQT